MHQIITIPSTVFVHLRVSSDRCYMMPPLYKPCTCILYPNPNPVAFVQRLRLPQTDRDERQTAWTSVTIPYIHGLSQSIHRVLSHLVIRVAFCPFQALRQELVPPRTLFQNYGEREWSTPSLVTSALGVTSARLDGLWSSAFGSIREHWGRGMCWPWRLLNMCLHRASRWTCARAGLWIFTFTPRPGVYWSPGTSNASRSLSTEKRAPCQDSTPLCWSDNTTNWHRISILWLPCYNY